MSRVRPARTHEADALSALAVRSKGHWGYDQAFLDRCRDELRVSEEQLVSDAHCYRVVEVDGVLAGFYALQRVSSEVFELDALFVEPAFIGRGIGRELVEHATRLATRMGASRMVIQGDPNAADFYRAAGAREAGERPSGSIPGRMLPLFVMELR